MDEIATGSFKLDACGGPKQAGPLLSVERRLKKVLYEKSNHFNLRKKYIRFYVDIRQTAEKCFFLLSLNWAGYHNNCFVSWVPFFTPERVIRDFSQVQSSGLINCFAIMQTRFRIFDLGWLLSRKQMAPNSWHLSISRIWNDFQI